MSQTKKMHNNEQIYHHRDHEEQPQHANHRVTIVKPNIKKIKIINP